MLLTRSAEKLSHVRSKSCKNSWEPFVNIIATIVNFWTKALSTRFIGGEAAASQVVKHLSEQIGFTELMGIFRCAVTFIIVSSKRC